MKLAKKQVAFGVTIMILSMLGGMAFIHVKNPALPLDQALALGGLFGLGWSAFILVSLFVWSRRGTGRSATS